MSYLTTHKIPLKRGYSEGTYQIEDTSESSPLYFNLIYFPLVVGGGRHIIKLKGNSLNMKIKTSIDVEIIDANNQRVFCEVVKMIDRFNNYYIYFDVYDTTARGIATAYFVGTAIVGAKGEKISKTDNYNVRWKKSFSILPYERNAAELIFNTPPAVTVAQIITPVTVNNISESYRYTTTTSSINQLSIVTSNFIGYDRDFATSEEILDPRLHSIKANPLSKQQTVNTVQTAIQTRTTDIIQGSAINYTTRFNTKLISTSSFFTKDHLGGVFEFFTSESTPSVLTPALPSGISVSGSISAQLETYNATIVEVLSNTQATLSNPVKIITKDANYISKNKLGSYTYRNASNFTGSITYIPSVLTFITSSTVSQSYVEFTFTDMNPISGEVYRIKTAARLGSTTGEYKQLNDQVIAPVEYLTDAEFRNGLNYARKVSDYRLVGHFVTRNILDEYWENHRESNGVFDTVTGSVNNSVLINSALIPASFTQSAVLSTNYNQNYNKNQIYSLGFNLTLDPYVELEVYMSSDPLNRYIQTSLLQLRAFNKTTNKESSRYEGSYSLFGKYIGTIKNNSKNTKHYGKVLFDFQTEGSGFGKPVIRSKIIGQTAGVTGSAYVSEVSIKPYNSNGFTPVLVQYAVQLPTELTAAATLSQSIDFKIDYFDFSGRQSEYTTYLDDVVLNLKGDIQSNGCQDDKVYFYYNSGFNASSRTWADRQSIFNTTFTQAETYP